MIFLLNRREVLIRLARSVFALGLMHQIDKDDPDDRLKIVRLYTQAERYRDARIELEEALDARSQTEGGVK